MADQLKDADLHVHECALQVGEFAEGGTRTCLSRALLALPKDRTHKPRMAG